MRRHVKFLVLFGLLTLLARPTRTSSLEVS